MKILDFNGLKDLVNNIKNLIKTTAESTLADSKAYTNENVELIKNQILDPDDYKASENGNVVVVDFEQGYISSSTGEEGESEGFLITSFIPVENDKFTLYSDAPVDSTIRIFVYDADKNWLKTANGDAGYYRISNGEKADITNKAKYIRCRIGSAATSGTLTVTFDPNDIIHQKIYFNNGYNMESTLIEDNLYQLQVNAEEDEFNIFTIAAPKNNASEATLALMLNDEEKTQFVDLSCMKYHEDEDGYFCTILQSRGDTPLPRYILGFNDGKGAGRVRKLEVTPDAIPMQFISDGIRVRKDNAYDNNWTDDNSVVVNLAELAEKEDSLQNQIDSIESGSTPVKRINPEYIGNGYTTREFYLNTHPENLGVLIPFINNDIAYLFKRGGSAVVKYDGIEQNVDISNLFDGSPSYCSIDPTNINEIVIELTLHKTFIWSNTVYVDMGYNEYRAKNVKLEVINTNFSEDVWTTKAEETNRSIAQFKTNFFHKPVGATNGSGGFNKIRLTFSNWNTTNIFRIAAIGIVNYDSQGLRSTFMPRDGGQIFGSVDPYYNDKYNLGNPDAKWHNVHADAFIGDLNGNAYTATKLQTARTINGVSFDGGSNIDINANPISNLLDNIDLDTIKDVGFYYSAGENTCSNKPENVDAFGMIVFKNAAGYTCQMLISGSDLSSIMYIRTWKHSVWSNWNKYYSEASKPTPEEIGAATSEHTHNYAGSSSAGGAAINSDKLDGYHADDFVFLQNFMASNLGSKTAYYSTSVNKDCNSIEDFAALAGGADGLHYPTANTYYYILTLKYADTAKKQIAFGYKGNVVDDIVFRTCNDGTWSAWKGINADTLDGYHSYDFCQTAFASETDMNKITVSGAYRVNQGNTNAPSGADWGQLFVVHGGGDTIAQFMFDYQKGRCWLRTGNPSDVNGSGAWTEWRSLYTSENITYGTNDLTPGSSSLTTGSIYYQYE